MRLNTSITRADHDISKYGKTVLVILTDSRKSDGKNSSPQTVKNNIIFYSIYIKIHRLRGSQWFVSLKLTLIKINFNISM